MAETHATDSELITKGACRAIRCALGMWRRVQEITCRGVV
jgi:hypothetical protein